MWIAYAKLKAMFKEASRKEILAIKVIFNTQAWAPYIRRTILAGIADAGHYGCHIGTKHSSVG